MAGQTGSPSTEAPARTEVRVVLEWKVVLARSASVVSVLHEVMLARRAEPRCRGCSLRTQADDVVSIRYEEAWDSETGLRRHVRSHGFASLVSLVESGAVEAPLVTFVLPEGTRGLDYAEEARASEGRAW